MSPIIIEVAAAFGLLVLLALAFTVGRRLGNRHPDEHPQLGVVQGATLGLMGLILGFSFSGAMTRFAAREELIVRHANAISTLWMRSALAGEQGSLIRTSLREYTQQLPAAFDAPTSPAFAQAQSQLGELESSMSDGVLSAVKLEPQLGPVLLAPLSEVLDARASRIAATNRHLPTLIVIAMLACATLSVGSIGYGMAGGRQSLLPPAIALILLMTCVLWVVLDLDYPRYGFIRISDAPLRDVLQSMTP